MVRRADDGGDAWGAAPEDEADLLAELDEAFPLGDGTAAMEAEVACPYCGELVTIGLDPGSGAAQRYEEDCQVCCRPWTVSVWYGEDGEADVAVEAADEGDLE
jgi:hypothetical protein